MRLLSVYSLELKTFNPATRPRYAIASHRWHDGDELTLQDLQEKRKADGYGYRKIKSFADFVRAHVHDVEWIWVDTCCIDKNSSQELQEAITAMYKWYEDAVVCLAWLEDIDRREDLHRSVWFTRGWTLQELLAPTLVVFLSRDWSIVGHKSCREDDELATLSIGTGPRLNRSIADATSIPEEVLARPKLRRTCTVDQKLSWMGARMTTRPEDMAYCLLGIFEVSMPLIYEEGKTAARRRLLRAIKEATEDAAHPSDALSSPAFIVPFSRDPDYVNRPELDILEDKSVTQAKVALVGLAGIGKSQIAIEHCYRIRKRSPGTRIVWTHASTAARFEESMRGIAYEAKISRGGNSRTVDVFQPIHDWLHAPENGPWLMVLDSVDSANFLFEPLSSDESQRENDSDAQRVLDYIPTCPHGSIVVTSRSRASAARIVGEDSIVVVEPMSREAADTLLRNKLGEPDSSALNELANLLGHLPLAIVQAAAYIKTKKLSLDQYLHKFKKSESWRAKLLEKPSLDSHAKPVDVFRRDREAKNSILSALQTLFERVSSSRPSAARLLSLLSFFDRRSIPVRLLLPNSFPSQLYHDTSEDDECSVDGGSAASNPAVVDEEILQKDLSTLSDNHLISPSPEEETFVMHTLVQLALRRWLKSRKQYGEWVARGIEYLDLAFPQPQSENHHICRSLYPHAYMLLGMKLERFESFGHASVLYKASEFALQQESGKEAEILARAARDARKSRLSSEMRSDDAQLMMYEMLLANALEQQGKDAAAEAKMRLVFEGREKVFGLEHPLTLSTLGELGSIQSKRGEYAAAEATHRQVLEMRQRMLHEDHPDTLSSLRSLAQVLFHRKNVVDAEEIYLKLLRIYRSASGNQHGDTLLCLNNLVVVSLRLGKSDAAESYSREVLEERTRTLGRDHPLTLLSLNNAASILAERGDHAAAEPLVREALKGSRKALGDGHPSTILLLSNLTTTLVNQGKCKAAEVFGRQALQGREKLLGEEHPLTLDICRELMKALWGQGEAKLDAAEALGRRAYEGRRKSLGEKHPDTLVSLADLVGILMDAGKHEAAETMARQLFLMRRRILGEDHQDTLTALSDVACTLHKRAKFSAAAELDREILERRQRTLGEMHEHTLASCDDLAVNLRKLGGDDHLEEAEALCRCACEGREQVLGKEHPLTLSSQGNLVFILLDRGDYELAEDMGRRVLDGREKVLGEEHFETLRILEALGASLRKQKRFHEAITFYERTLTLHENRSSASSPNAFQCRRMLALLREEAGIQG